LLIFRHAHIKKVKKELKKKLSYNVCEAINKKTPRMWG